jgi:transcription antitermination factor NusG
MMIEKAWYGVYTKPLRETIAVSNLANQNIPTLYPQTRIQSPFNRHKTLDRPLFPRYLFAQLEPHQLSAARHTRGVSRLIEFEDGNPVTIEDWIIEEIAASLDEQGFHKLSFNPKVTPKPGMLVQTGSLVRVALGALMGICGVLREKRGRWGYVQTGPSGRIVQVPLGDLVSYVV